MKSKMENGCEGRLPSMAPLANPYVPYQLENPPQYETRRALIRGTLFPGLDLPFRGMANQTEQTVTPLTELQAMAFALQELALYLDTHQEDTDALEMYRTYQTLYHDASMAYADKYGPLNHNIPVSGKYQWLNDPWPWEYSVNQKEG